MRRSVGELKKLAATVYGGLTRGQRAVLVVAIVAGVVVRVLALDRLPGIDGDEAWYGVNVHLLLDR
jgi:hypothetical protein